MIDKNKIEAAKEEIYEDRFLLNGEEVVFDNDDKEEMLSGLSMSLLKTCGMLLMEIPKSTINVW